MDKLLQFKLEKMVDLAEDYAANFSDCLHRKKNAAIIITETGQSVFGVNHIADGDDKEICNRCPRIGKQSGVWDPAGEECPVIHAETSAIIRAASLGMAINAGSIFTLYYPCMPCARAIVDAGLRKVYYRDPYDGPEFDRVKAYLDRAGLLVFKVEASRLIEV